MNQNFKAYCALYLLGLEMVDIYFESYISPFMF